MIPSPLSLEWYFIKELRVAWQPDFDGSEARSLLVSDLSVEVLPSQNKEEPLKWGFELVLSLDDKTGKRFPYTFQIALVGFFEIAKAYAERNPNGAELLAIVNGPAVLYSAAREHITTVTSRGPYPEVILPTVTFLPVDDKPSELQEPQTAKAVSKTAPRKVRKRSSQKS